MTHNDAAPRIARVVLPPVLASAVSQPASQQTKNVTSGAVALLSSRTDPEPRAVPATETMTRSLTPTGVNQPKYICPHPCTGRVAYVLMPEGTETHQVLCVQDTVTQQVIWNASWAEIALLAWADDDHQRGSSIDAAGPPDPMSASFSKWVSSFMGQLVQLAFDDPSTLHWSGMLVGGEGSNTNSRTANSPTTAQWQGLMVQTTKRILILNLRRGPQASPVWLDASTTSSFKKLILAHLSDTTLLNSAIPSSNALPLTPDWLLVGCVDGSLKCFSRKAQQTVKSIKGLGKGDHCQLLLAANAYSTTTNVHAARHRRRMVTVTKKGTAYLIELELVFLKSKSGASTASLEIKPPLARFSIGMSPTETGTSPSQLHNLLQYDAHRDWLLWCHPNHNTPNGPVLHIWNLQALQKEFIKAENNKQGGVLKPDPSLNLELVGGSRLSMVHAAGLVGTAWGDDPQTFLAVAVTQTGELFLQGAVLPMTYQPQMAQATATPVLGVRLSDLLQRDGGLDYDGQIPLQIHAVRTFTLGPTSHELLVATSVGMLMVQIPLPPMTGARHVHFGAGLGSLGKSILTVQESQVVYAAVDSLTVNPSGFMLPTNPVRVYTSPPPKLPLVEQRPFRAGSSMLLPSPSGRYVALLWPAEYKYEILHTSTLMLEVEQARGDTSSTKRSACVASGTGVADFCWVGDQDVYAILHVPGWEQAVSALVPAFQESTEAASRGGVLTLTAPKLKDLGAGVMNVAMSATSAATSVTKAATSKTRSATKAVSSKTLSTTMAATKTVNKGFKKASFGLFGGKKKKGRDDTGMADTSGDDDGSESVSTTSVMSQITPPVVGSMPAQTKEKMRYVELRELVSIDTQGTEVSGSIAAATSSSLGKLMLRGGNRTIPTVLFGGPVLCVGSRAEGSDIGEGEAHFYTRKKDEKDDHASAYLSTGPTLPYPDVCTWDDDGRFFAVAIGSRVAVYLSEEPNFVLLGTARIGSPSLSVAEVVSLKFIHGVLYCCTWNSVHCILLGDVVGGGVCHMDSYLLASTDAPAVMVGQGLSGDHVVELAPTPLALPLAQPVVLGYQSGSLMVSTLRGVYAIPLDHPLLRIGILLSSGQVDRATSWLDAVPDDCHEALACFLERRGHAELALQYLPGLSLETIVDMCMRHGFVSRLEEAVETYGARGLRAIDMGRGVATSIFGPEASSSSLIVCVGAYLLAHGRLELVRRLASECLRLDDLGRKDAFFLGTLLLPVNESDASRLINRAVEQADDMQDWLMGKFVRDYILKKGSNRT